MKQMYPFVALVGQERMKLALLMCAVSPSVGGVLVRGDKGTAKSTAARALSEILPPSERSVGCKFNCDLTSPLDFCDVCNNGRKVQIQPAPFVDLPLGATEDRVIGTLDFQQALKSGKRSFQPGMLAAAHTGILYIDEVNLLPDHLVDVLLDAAAMGRNVIEREGLSITHPAKISLIGSMNPEEGDLRPQLLDRFGIMVEVKAPTNPEERVEVIRRRMAYERDPQSFRTVWQEEQDNLSVRIAAARARLDQVVATDEQLLLISSLCCEFGIASLRADIVMSRVATAHAAFEGRTNVSLEDIKVAAQLVLPHRKRRKPGDKCGLDEETLDEMLEEEQKRQDREQKQQSPEQSSRQDQATQPDRSPSTPPPPLSDPDSATPPAESEQHNTGSAPSSQVFAIAKSDATLNIRLAGHNDSEMSSAGRHASAVSKKRGHYIRATKDPNPQSLAVDATIKHSVMRTGTLSVDSSDLHAKHRIEKTATLVIFVVDASGSMAARKRMESVKGAVKNLLVDAYQKRDQVCVVSFRADKAEIVLAPTRSVEQAEESLAVLETGGLTPLASALELTLDSLDRWKQLKMEPLLVLLTDGKANVAPGAGSDAWQSALRAASDVKDTGTAAIVIDTEFGYVALGRAQDLAQAMGAEYVKLDKLDAEALSVLIKGKLHAGRARQ